VQAAAFAVSAGECKPPLAEVDREPPPPAEEPAKPVTNSTSTGELKLGTDGVARPAEAPKPKKKE